MKVNYDNCYVCKKAIKPEEAMSSINGKLFHKECLCNLPTGKFRKVKTIN